MNKIMNILVLVLVVFALQACSGVQKKIVHAEDGTSYKLEEVYSIGLFVPTYQWKRTSQCTTVVTHINSTKHGTGYDSKSVKDCKLIGVGTDGFTADTASPMGPALLSVGATVGAGALIKEGLQDSSVSGGDGVTVNNSNVNSNSNCVGNCGGGK